MLNKYIKLLSIKEEERNKLLVVFHKLINEFHLIEADKVNVSICKLNIEIELIKTFIEDLKNKKEEI